MSSEKSEAEKLAEAFIKDVRSKAGRYNTYLAGFKAAVEQAVRHSMDVPFHGITERHVKLSDLQKLLEPPTTRQQIKDLLEDV